MNTIKRPTLFVNEKVCKDNIARMARKAKSQDLELRPHFKTHQSHAIGQWFREEGVTGITVSSLGMANYFAHAGWTDITVAFPCNINEIDLINELSSSIQLRILVDNEEIVEMLSNQLINEVKVYIEVDSGGNRTGVSVQDSKRILALADLVTSKSNLSFLGIYSHAGHTYGANGQEDIMQIANSSLKKLNLLKNILLEKHPTTQLCFGDTPSCSVLESLDGVDAISAGNFVFYDLMQTEIGACTTENIGVALACPIVSINREKEQVSIYGGGVHFSKDRTDLNYFGRVASYNNSHFEIIEDGYLSKISQEHGIVKMRLQDLNKLSVGDSLLILPIHSCMTADCMGEYELLNTRGMKLDHYSQKKHVL